MNRLQKIAWCFVITISIAVVISITAVGLLAVKVGLPTALYGFSLIGLGGLAGVASVFFKKDRGKVSCDERDVLINKTAKRAGFTAAFLVVGLACMIPFFVLGPNASISVTWLPQIFIAATLSHYYVYSLAVLVLYGRGAENGEN